MSEGFELDKTAQGKMRVNVISVANLITLIGVLIVAAGTWTTLNSQVSTIGTKVDLFQVQVRDIRTDLQTSILQRDNVSRELDSKVGQISNRLTAVETILQRVERKLEASAPTPSPH